GATAIGRGRGTRATNPKLHGSRLQYDVDTPEEYLAQLEDDWRRRTLLSLRALIQASAPHLEEGIQYKMLAYHDAAGSVFGLNAQKGYVSLYVGDIDKIDATGELLSGLSRGKGCIRFTKTTDVAGTRIDEFVARAARLRAE